MQRLKKSSDATLVQQLVSWIEHRIQEQVYRVGMRIPSVRQLAEEKGISRFTVVAAYEKLVALGLLESRRGSGFYVKAQPSSLPINHVAPPLRPDIDVDWLIRNMHASTPQELSPGLGYFPNVWLEADMIGSAIRSVGRENCQQLLTSGTLQGYLPLRQHLQRRLAEIEIDAKPEQIILTTGVSHSLDLLARHYLQAGDTVLVGDPGWFSMFAKLATLGVKMLGIPYHADGPDLNKLAELAALHQPKLLIINSVLQNPTGLSLTAAQAFKILQLAEQFDFQVVEDDIYSDLAPRNVIRLASLDQLKRVIYISSYSKSIAANLRVGYIACNHSITQQLSNQDMVAGLTNPELNQRVLLKILTEGRYRKHLDRLQQKMDIECALAKEKLERIGLKPFSSQSRGMFLWMDLGQDSNKIAAAGHEEGLLFAPGSLFSPSQKPSTWMRFNIATSQSPKMLQWLAKKLEN